MFWHNVCSQKMESTLSVTLWQRKMSYIQWSPQQPWMKVYFIPCWSLISGQSFLPFFWVVSFGGHEILYLISNIYFATALDSLVEHRITGFPVIDDNWKLVSYAYPFSLVYLLIKLVVFLIQFVLIKYINTLYEHLSNKS